MIKKALVLLPILAINIVLLGLFALMYIPTLTRCPEYFLTGYSLLMLISIGLFLLTGYCVRVLFKKPTPDLEFPLFRHPVLQLAWIPLLAVTLVHTYLMLGSLSSVSSCPIDPTLPFVGGPLNSLWASVAHTVSIIAQ